MKRAISILLISVLLGSTGCEQSDILTLPEPDAALAINSIGYNAHVWRARITPVHGVLDGKYFEGIRNADIRIYENGTFMESLVASDIASGGYTGASPGWPYTGITEPRPGKTYKVTVEAPGYPSITSEFVQPDSIPVEFFAVKELGKIDNPRAYPNGATNMQFTLGFTDPPGKNYYEFYVQAVGDSIYTDGYRSHIVYGFALTFLDPAYQKASETFNFTVVTIDDSFFDGKTVRLDFTSVFSNFLDPGWSPPDSYTVYIRNISKEYYQYLKTTSLQRKANDDPYAQPVLVENNIKDGYGIFGGLTESSKTIPPPQK